MADGTNALDKEDYINLPCCTTTGLLSCGERAHGKLSMPHVLTAGMEDLPSHLRYYSPRAHWLVDDERKKAPKTGLYLYSLTRVSA
jgi:hypothetical protein